MTLAAWALLRTAAAGAPDESEGVLRDARSLAGQAVSWLRTQQVGDGRFGANSPPAATALAVKALRGMGEQDSEMLRRADAFLRKFVESCATNSGFAGINVDVCRKVLRISPSEADAARAIEDWTSALSRYDRDESVLLRDFELRQVVWGQERSAMLAKGQDPDQFMAETLARTIVPQAAITQKPATNGLPDPNLRVRRSRRGYGSISYAGMLALLYDNARSDDPRVDATLDWAERSWSLDWTPRKGQAGLYFFYHSMAKCLRASGEEEVLPLQGGESIRWRKELVRKLAQLRRIPSGEEMAYWKNDDPSYLEGDAVLVTAYVLLTLENILADKGMERTPDRLSTAETTGG